MSAPNIRDLDYLDEITRHELKGRAVRRTEDQVRGHVISTNPHGVVMFIDGGYQKVRLAALQVKYSMCSTKLVHSDVYLHEAQYNLDQIERTPSRHFG